MTNDEKKARIEKLERERKIEVLKHDSMPMYDHSVEAFGIRYRAIRRIIWINDEIRKLNKEEP